MSTEVCNSFFKLDDLGGAVAVVLSLFYII